MPLIGDGVKYVRLSAAVGLGAMPGVVAEDQSVTRLRFNKHLARKTDLFLGDAVALERSKNVVVNVS